ncbi:MAG: lamin tail domain-containing protein [Flavobacteriales bacterium]|nr:lamin tail domain-containing protein [Flavobacteriales bacterium]
MKKLLLVLSVFGASVAAHAQGCDEIFISEYIEGWSNNKAIELYNPTGNDIDLEAYKLERYSNGQNSAADNQKLELGGIIPAYGTYVIVIDKRDPDGTGQEAPVWEELQAKADTFMCPVYDDNNTMYFNGDDAVVLRKIASNAILDVIGKVGENPGYAPDGGGWNNVGPAFTWVANGEVSWTTDHTLIRKESITMGDADGLNLFDVSIEFDSLPANTFENLGSHSSVCGSDFVSEITLGTLSVFPNPSNDGIITVSADDQLKQITVFDIRGNQVFTTELSAAQRSKQLSLNHLPNGSYVILAETRNGEVIRNKFVIE